VPLSGYSGLSENEAAQRLRRDGPNTVPSAERRNAGRIALEVIGEPMSLLLVLASSIYFALGDPHEAVLLLSFVVMISIITLYQELKTERALAALRALASPRARALRDGKEKLVPGQEVVRGDIIILREGDRVPADAVLLACHDLMADESLLTGESLPVRKVRWDGTLKVSPPGGDDLPFVYSGSLLTQGQGIAEVVATGISSEIGKIGRALQTLSDEPSPLQRETTHIVAKLAVGAWLLSAVVVVVFGTIRGNWLDAMLAGVTLAMSITPNEYPVVLTIFLALGAWRISRHGVLTRRIPAIETLGAATVLCVDKTGTLTENRMSIKELHASGAQYEVRPHDAALPELFHPVLEFGILASEANPFDPMEQAFQDVGRRFLVHTEHMHRDWSLVREYPLTPQLLAHSHGWLAADGTSAVATKGAPEAVADLCRLSPAARQALEAQAQSMAARGLRVLAVAHATLTGNEWPADPHDLDFELVGLVGLADPLRPTVAHALQECRSAGLRVVMITGDYPATAQAIAREIGLASPGGVLSGPELDAMPAKQLGERISEVNIFARMVPEQKLRLVQVLRAGGAIVAMTGDGVNDAPALKAAHIGIAMGARGTDVAREAAALVLLKDDFASIVHAVRMGRRIYDNIRNAMSYLLAVHVPIAGMSLLPLLFDLPLMLFPAHVVFLEFIIAPACSIVFESDAEQSDVMRRAPRPADERLFSAPMILLSLLQGFSVLLAVWLTYQLSLNFGSTEPEARALAFTTLVLSNLGMILTSRSPTQTLFATLAKPNAALWFVLTGALVALALVLYVPEIATQFRLAQPAPWQWMACAGAAIAGAALPEVYKAVRYRGR
jgi:Ca2+-transporting ATPase